MTTMYARAMTSQMPATTQCFVRSGSSSTTHQMTCPATRKTFATSASTVHIQMALGETRCAGSRSSTGPTVPYRLTTGGGGPRLRAHGKDRSSRVHRARRCLPGPGLDVRVRLRPADGRDARHDHRLVLGDPARAQD